MNRRLAAAVAAALAAGVLAPAAAQQQSDEARQGQQDQQQGQPGQQGQDRQEQPTAIARAGDPAAEGFGIPTPAIDVERSGEYGRFLVDERGQPIYVLESESSGESGCYDACALAWPPVLAPDGEEVDTRHRALDDDLLGMTERRDGRMQLTYNDYPLYFYARDPGDGEVTGHDVMDKWGEWYLVTPEGEPLHREGEDDDEDSRG